MEIIMTWTHNTVIFRMCIKARLQVESITTLMNMLKDTVAGIF